MAKIARLNVMISANSKGLTSGVKRANAGIDSLTARARGMRVALNKSFNIDTSRLRQLGGNVAQRAGMGLRRIGYAAVAAAVGMAYFVKKTAEGIDTAAKFSRRVGVSYTKLKAYQLAAGLAGIESEALNKAFEKMSDTLGAAFSGDNAAVKAFENIGLSVEHLQRMQPEKRFDAISAAISRIPDPAARINAARDIFGKQGGALLELFAGGSAAVADATEKVKTFGLALSDIQTAGIEYALDRLSEIGSVIEGIGTQIAAKVAPYVSQIANDFISWIEGAGGVEAIVERIAGHIDRIAAKFSRIGNIIFGNGLLPESIQKMNPVGGIPGHGVVHDMLPGGGSSGGGSSGGGVASGALERARAYGSRARANAAARAQDSENAPAVEAAKAQRQAEQYQMYQRYQMQPPEVKYKKSPEGGNGYLSKIPSGTPGYMSKIPGGVPNYVNKMPGAAAAKAGGDTEQTTLLRQIAANTGRNTVGFAG